MWNESIREHKNTKKPFIQKGLRVFRKTLQRSWLYYPFSFSYQKLFSSGESLSRVQLFVTPWSAAWQASLSITKLLEFTQTHIHWIGNSIQPSHPLPSLWHQCFPVSRSFKISQFFASGGQSIGVSDSVSDLPVSIQDWFPLGHTGWMSLQSKGL